VPRSCREAPCPDLRIPHWLQAQHVPFARCTIFFHDPPAVVVPGVAGDLHLASSPGEQIRHQFWQVTTVCDVAFCDHSTGFLAAPYAGGNCSGILRRADCRSISQTGRHRVSSTTREGRETSVVVERRSGPSYCPGHRAGQPRRGFVTLERPLPRFMEVRRLARGSVAFYFRIPTYYRALGCEMANEPLGTSYEAAGGDDDRTGLSRLCQGNDDASVSCDPQTTCTSVGAEGARSAEC